jgi:hypothetical protein
MATVDRAKKISELQQKVAPTGDDLLVIVDNSSAATTKYVKVGDFLANGTSNVSVSNSATLSANTFVIRRVETPLASTGSVGIEQGTIFYDSNYLYVAVANNTIKRVALSTF